MRIGFIGAGRVGCTLGKFLSAVGCQSSGRSVCESVDEGMTGDKTADRVGNDGLGNVEVVGYYSRNPVHAKEAAEFTDTLYFEDACELVRRSDAVFLTVSDTAIADVARWLDETCDLTGKIICHTSGAMSSSVITDSVSSDIYSYSIHPIYAFSDRFTAIDGFDKAYITLEGDERYIDVFKDIFTSRGLGCTVIGADSKVIYHAAAVYASNFVCGLYGTAVGLMMEAGFDEAAARKALSGLFLANTEGIAEHGEVAQLTGPVERGDTVTVKKHLAELSKLEERRAGELRNTEDPDSMTTLYRLLALETLKVAEKKNKDRSYSDMESLLKEDD